jgi:hypothetical protein
VTLYEFTAGTLALPISPAQGMLLAALDGCRFTPEQAEVFREAARREPPQPGTTFREIRVIKGVRSGFTTMVAAPAVLYRAVYGSAPSLGVHSVLPLVAQDERGARVDFHGIREYALSVPEIAEHVTSAGSGEISFDTGHTVTVYPSSAPALRGPAFPMACMDEYGFVRHAHEIRASLRRGLLGTGGVLLRGSSPWIKEGLCYEDFQALGNDDPDVLTLHGGTRFWNPAISQEELDAEQRIDPVRFAREYLGLFTDDLAAFLPAQAVEDAVSVGIFERAPEPGRAYVAACDMSAGGPDATTFTICHREGDRVVQDVLKGYRRVNGQSPNLANVVAEIATTLRQYGIREIVGDRFAGQWSRQEFQRAGITYRNPEITRDGRTIYVDRSTAYLEVGPLFLQGLVDLLDHADQQREFQRLERRARVGGGDVVDHPKNGHDDYANSFALAATMLIGKGDVQYRIRRPSEVELSEAGIQRILQQRQREQEQKARVRAEAVRVLADDLGRQPTPEEESEFVREMREWGFFG